MTLKRPTLAIIPARSGSKGIPNKNLMRLAGRSILEWTVRAAIEAIGAENVVVSSDGEQILSEAKKLGVLTHLRSAESSNDTASSESALLEAISDLRSQGIEADRILFMQCTSPCILADDLTGLIKTFESKQLDSGFTATSSHAFLWQESDTGVASGINHDMRVRQRRQDRPAEYRENGAAYLFSTSGFEEYKHRFFGKCGLYEMPEGRSWEIDSREDAIVVETQLKSQVETDSIDFDWCRAVVFDFDGVLTDNAVWVDENGVESVRCDRGDGFGFELARKAGLKTLILSKEQNIVVSKRAEKLRCEVAQGVEDKPAVLTKWLSDQKMTWNDIVYVGNDLNDIECIQLARVGVAVADAYLPVKDVANLILSNKGGHGAAREILTTILRDRKNETE